MRHLGITIVGGGLAGLTLGIGLRQRGVPVTICEAGVYPRHRVCGEFICGQGLGVLQAAGLEEKFLAAGARRACSVSFHSASRSYSIRPIRPPALCLSRFVMDELLANEFRALGGILRERERIAADELAPGWVRATGRRIAKEPSHLRWIGLKAHARNVLLISDLEMHFQGSGYVGLCRLDAGTVNVCGLFAVRGPMPELARRWPEFLCGQPGTVLHERLQAAGFDRESFRAVSSLNLRPSFAAQNADCRIGDALTMVPPVTGNGMSMAFEAAQWAADPLQAYSRGDLPWEAARQAIARHCDAGFADRLRWACWLQWLLMRRGTRRFLLWASQSDRLWNLWFAKTR